MLALCAVLLIFNLLTSTQDIATDGLAIEILTSSQVASGNIAQVVGYKIGAIIGGGLLAWLSDYITWSVIFFLLAAIYASAVIAVKNLVPAKCRPTFDISIDVPYPSDAKAQHLNDKKNIEGEECNSLLTSENYTTVTNKNFSS
jgi:MFS family permease